MPKIRNPILQTLSAKFTRTGKLQTWSAQLGRSLKGQTVSDRFKKTPATKEENPTIGMVLCKQKNEALVEITLPKKSNIHAREYKLYLPSKVQLQKKLQEWAAEVEG